MREDRPQGDVEAKNRRRTALTIDANKTYTATSSTTCGDITIALDAKAAPKGVNNFVFLARQGFYDGLTFTASRTTSSSRAATPRATGTVVPATSVVTELPADGYPLGSLAYAKGERGPTGTAGSQFFIVTGDRPRRRARQRAVSLRRASVT